MPSASIPAAAAVDVAGDSAATAAVTSAADTAALTDIVSAGVVATDSSVAPTLAGSITDAALSAGGAVSSVASSVGGYISPLLTGASLLGKLAGAGTQAYGTIAQGNANRATLDNEAAQLNVEAGQTRASAQQQEQNALRAGAYAESADMARTAASGADPNSVQSVDSETNLAGMAEYNALTALFNGNEKASSMNYAAQNDVLKGEAAAQAGQIAAGSKLAGTLAGMGASTLYSNNTDPYDPNSTGY